MHDPLRRRRDQSLHVGLGRLGLIDRSVAGDAQPQAVFGGLLSLSFGSSMKTSPVMMVSVKPQATNFRDDGSDVKAADGEIDGRHRALEIEARDLSLLLARARRGVDLRDVIEDLLRDHIAGDPLPPAARPEPKSP